MIVVMWYFNTYTIVEIKSTYMVGMLSNIVSYCRSNEHTIETLLYHTRVRSHVQYDMVQICTKHMWYNERRLPTLHQHLGHANCKWLVCPKER